MNWYKFKIELFAIVTGTAMLTLSALVLMAFGADLGSSVMNHPLWMRPAVENPDVVLAGFSAAIGLMWLCRWQTFKILRNAKAYGER